MTMSKCTFKSDGKTDCERCSSEHYKDYMAGADYCSLSNKDWNVHRCIVNLFNGTTSVCTCGDHKALLDN